MVESALHAQVVALAQVADHAHRHAQVLRGRVAKAAVHVQAVAVAQVAQVLVQVITARAAVHAQVRDRVASAQIVARRVVRSVRVADVVQAQR